MNQGSVVVATERITEEGFDGDGEYVHAEAGDEGEVLEVINDDGSPWLMVRWSRHGTVAQVHPSELAAAALPAVDAA